MISRTDIQKVSDLPIEQVADALGLTVRMHWSLCPFHQDSKPSLYYRCSQLNAAVGGSKTSQHMKGEACDIYLKDQRKLLEWFAHLTNGEFDQLILERSSTSSLHYWIHVSCKPDLSKNRHIVIQGMVKE